MPAGLNIMLQLLSVLIACNSLMFKLLMEVFFRICELCQESL